DLGQQRVVIIDQRVRRTLGADRQEGGQDALQVRDELADLDQAVLGRGERLNRLVDVRLDLAEVGLTGQQRLRCEIGRGVVDRRRNFQARREPARGPVQQVRRRLQRE